MNQANQQSISLYVYDLLAFKYRNFRKKYESLFNHLTYMCICLYASVSIQLVSNRVLVFLIFMKMLIYQGRCETWTNQRKPIVPFNVMSVDSFITCFLSTFVCAKPTDN
jgi:hypothetical protein